MGQMRGELQSVDSRAVQRQRALIEVALRPDQIAFAAQVRKSRRDRCRLSGFSGLFCDAAHLVNFASCDAKGAADPGNGIFLAAHLHKAFNRHLFGITPDGEIVCIWR
jgi:putative restriction endonuclease